MSDEQKAYKGVKVPNLDDVREEEEPEQDISNIKNKIQESLKKKLPGESKSL